MAPARFTARYVESLALVDAQAWDACANPPGLSEPEAAGERHNPFVSHAFLIALEQSKSVGGRTGWTPAHVLVEDAAGRLVAARAGLSEDAQHGRICLRPFLGAGLRARGRALLSEASGRRAVHARHRPAPAGAPATRPRARAEALIAALRGLRKAVGASSIHVTFANDRRRARRSTRAGFARAHRRAVPFPQRGLRRFRRVPRRARLAQAQDHQARAARRAGRRRRRSIC